MFIIFWRLGFNEEPLATTILIIFYRCASITPLAYVLLYELKSFAFIRLIEFPLQPDCILRLHLIIYRASCFLALATTILHSVVVSKAKRKAMSDKAGFFVSLASFSQVIAFSMLSATSFTSVLSIYSSMSKTSLLPFSGSCRI